MTRDLDNFLARVFVMVLLRIAVDKPFLLDTIYRGTGWMELEGAAKLEDAAEFPVNALGEKFKVSADCLLKIHLRFSVDPSAEGDRNLFHDIALKQTFDKDFSYGGETIRLEFHVIDHRP